MTEMRHNDWVLVKPRGHHARMPCSLTLLFCQRVSTEPQRWRALLNVTGVSAGRAKGHLAFSTQEKLLAPEWITLCKLPASKRLEPWGSMCTHRQPFPDVPGVKPAVAVQGLLCPGWIFQVTFEHVWSSHTYLWDKHRVSLSPWHKEP